MPEDDAAVLAHARAGEFLLAWDAYVRLCTSHRHGYAASSAGEHGGLPAYLERSRELDTLAQEILALQRSRLRREVSHAG